MTWQIRGIEGSQTFISVLIKTTKGIDVIVAAVRHRGIDQACGDMPFCLLDARPVIASGLSASRGTGGQ